MPARWVLIALLCAVPAMAAAPPFPGAQRKWRHYTSPHFELYSSDNDRVSREILRNLELIHAAFLEYMRIQVRRPIPVTVFAFGDDDEFRAYLPGGMGREGIKGIYLHRPDRAVIMVAPRDELKDARRTIYHEYIHHLFRIGEEDPPAWYNEGMAELFATIEEVDGELQFGKGNPGRVLDLQVQGLMPFEQLFAVDHTSPVLRQGRHAGQFYAQSWALLHFCHFGVTKLPKEKLSRFLEVARSPQLEKNPERVRAICRELLEIDYPELHRQLDRYIRGGKYRWGKLAVPKNVPEKAALVARDVPPEESLYRLAELMARTSRTGQAKYYLLDGASKRPTDVRLNETLGMLARMEGDEAGMRDRWSRALEAGSTNPAVFHELAESETRWLFQHFDPYYRMPDETAARLRRLLLASIESAPRQTKAYEILAWVEASAGAPEAANVNRVQAQFPLLKRRDGTVVALAMIRHRIGQNDEALKLLDSLSLTEPDDWCVDAAEQLRAKIEGRKLSAGERGPRVRRIPIRIGPGEDRGP